MTEPCRACGPSQETISAAVPGRMLLGPPLQPLPAIRVLIYLLGDRAEVQRILSEAEQMRVVKEPTRNSNAIWRVIATWNPQVRYQPLPATLAVSLEYSGWQIIGPSEPPRAGDVAVFGEDDEPQRLALVAKERARPTDRLCMVDEQGYRNREDTIGLLYWLRFT